MFGIGDVVNYKDGIGCVTSVSDTQLRLAMHTGNSVTCEVSEAVLLVSAHDMLEQFERSILAQCKQEVM